MVHGVFAYWLAGHKRPLRPSGQVARAVSAGARRCPGRHPPQVSRHKLAHTANTRHYMFEPKSGAAVLRFVETECPKLSPAKSRSEMGAAGGDRRYGEGERVGERVHVHAYWGRGAWGATRRAATSRCVSLVQCIRLCWPAAHSASVAAPRLTGLRCICGDHRGDRRRGVRAGLVALLCGISLQVGSATCMTAHSRAVRLSDQHTD